MNNYRLKRKRTVVCQIRFFPAKKLSSSFYSAANFSAGKFLFISRQENMTANLRVNDSFAIIIAGLIVSDNVLPGPNLDTIINENARCYHKHARL